jgi:hypothetical protein
MLRLILVISVCAVAACAPRSGLHNLETASGGPDDFSILPSRALEIPQSLELPQPTPGGTNLTDPNPKGDAIAALGGSARAAIAGGIPARDTALVAHAGRNGVAADIRAELAAADATLRSGGITGLFRGRGYFDVYARQALDAQAELARFRAAGVATPTAPPAN